MPSQYQTVMVVLLGCRRQFRELYMCLNTIGRPLHPRRCPCGFSHLYQLSAIMIPLTLRAMPATCSPPAARHYHCCCCHHQSMLQLPINATTSNLICEATANPIHASTANLVHATTAHYQSDPCIQCSSHTFCPIGITVANPIHVNPNVSI